ncbi:hypothetical protein AMATHDRAFT_59535 [Amanita thiersii Skay4041]|uniref:Prolyl 4-hydroxylase alpha subunit domain-containing protein n=1 Tax=Amanita thiersii Skay4041 TaxID=703135 RepID=A0A2A9NMB0_9AGAR|nr:hypothetical protein AMATHDRAFT_59535 [Amanita thiersii Skay4041]
MAPTVQRIDFSTQSSGLVKNYHDFYALIIDNVFSPQDCTSFIDLANTSGIWSPAGLSAGEQTQTVHTEFRNSERIIVINEDKASMIYDRLRPLVDDIHIITPTGPWSSITGKRGRKQGPTWKLVNVNPRLSFLRYGPGHYFKPHCDGLTELNNGQQQSFVTLFVYLNDDAVLNGGATRFWTPDKKEYLDVEPKLGRVLVFQQRMLVHSGEEVKGGMKYTMRSDFMFEQVLS